VIKLNTTAIESENHSSDVVIRYMNIAHKFSNDRIRLWQSWLDEHEQQRLARMSKPYLQQQYLVSHAMVRSVLADMSDQLPQHVQFEALQQGKPMMVPVKGQPMLHFSLAHSHGLAAVAVSQNGPVGLDIEHLKRKVSSLAVAKRFFSKKEYLDITSHTQEKQQYRLLQYWTLKEALVKAEGWGISVGIDCLEFDLDTGTRPLLTVLDSRIVPRERWEFGQFNLLDEYLLAIAAYPSPQNPSLVIDCAPWSWL